ncbi:methyltransferase domain-containing protein [Thalassoglobus sp. JC818]|uniref:class I SAM-dependent methyltransferase n=1 Tax=Thalassoglobus sp. JC818 TaxID=3232136 RepID=UPI00345949A1
MRSLTIWLTSFVLLLIVIPPQVDAQDESLSAPLADLRYSYQRNHDPNGIGKFYLGREIARVMGHQGIRWLERPEREEEERLSKLIEGLNIEPGMTVADIGAGSGVISVLLSEAVGPSGTVLAVDIQPEMLEALQAKCKFLEIDNVVPVLGTTKSPRLEAGTVDLIVMVDVYHEFDFPFEMLQNISQALKLGGRVAFVEYRKEDPYVPIKEVHKMSEAQVKAEALVPAHGLRWAGTFRRLPRQHVVIFSKEK